MGRAVNKNTNSKGIRVRSSGNYQAYFCFSNNGKSVYKTIGTYSTVREATENRDKFIDSLK